MSVAMKVLVIDDEVDFCHFVKKIYCSPKCSIRRCDKRPGRNRTG